MNGRFPSAPTILRRLAIVVLLAIAVSGLTYAASFSPLGASSMVGGRPPGGGRPGAPAASAAPQAVASQRPPGGGRGPSLARGLPELAGYAGTVAGIVAIMALGQWIIRMRRRRAVATELDQPRHRAGQRRTGRSGLMGADRAARSH